MSRRRSSPLLTILGAGLGAWAVTHLLRRWHLDAQPDFFRGKVVLITGASRGLGQAYAQGFAARGASLALAARSEDQLAEVAAGCRALNEEALDEGVQVLVVPTDVTDEAQLEALVEAVLDRFGRIDILLNNAGIRQGGPLLEVGAESMHRQVEVNLVAPINLTLLVLPVMLRQGEGHVVNVASAAGRHAEPYFIPYGTSKHGLVGFSEGLRREMAGTGVQVTTVNPGFVDTDMVTHIGPVYRRMGFEMIPPERVVARTLDGIVLGLPEVNVGWLETLGGWASKLFPALADFYWRVLLPNDFEEAALRQRSD
jgi:NAD(P)-dependent dehydrogenase (short-subunit alcohol dehydrogenase family)